MNDRVKAKKPEVILLKRPSNEPGTLKVVGGSNSDDWNQRIAVDTLSALWVKNSHAETKDGQYQGALAGLIGIAPKDELEGSLCGAQCGDGVLPAGDDLGANLRGTPGEPESGEQTHSKLHGVA